jgi:hypothetical protein
LFRGSLCQRTEDTLDRLVIFGALSLVGKLPLKGCESITGEKHMNKSQTKMILTVGLAALTLLPAAKADQRNQKTVLTFSDPVEIPGQILPAGTYVFKLADSHSHRNIVQVFDRDQTHVFGTFIAIPDYRLHPSDKTIIRFDERPQGEPQAIKAWFYPGRNYGHEFVYPKSKALELAKANQTPVPSMPTDLTADTTNPTATMNGPEVAALNLAPLKAEKPDGEEVELTELFGVAYAYHPFERGGELPAKLPATASSLPLAGVVALVSMGIAMALRLRAARMK